LSISNPQTVPLPGPEAHAAPPAVDLPLPEPVVSKTSGLAIASLVLSFLGPFGCIPAVICGHIARAKIKQDSSLGGDGLAKAGLIIGYLFLLASIVIVLLVEFTSMN
jgi:hypothetical protein